MAADKAKGEAANALSKLAQWERGHERLFKELHDRVLQQYMEMPVRLRCIVKRIKLYTLIVAWTSPVLLALTWLMLLTGLGTFKGTQLSRVTLGLLRSAAAGKLHTVWLPLAVGLLSYLHGIFGLQILVHRWRLIKQKKAWEIGLFVLGAALLLQFLLLYWG